MSFTTPQPSKNTRAVLRALSETHIRQVYHDWKKVNKRCVQCDSDRHVETDHCCRGQKNDVSQLVNEPVVYLWMQLPVELAKRRLLCSMRHKDETDRRGK